MTDQLKVNEKTSRPGSSSACLLENAGTARAGLSDISHVVKVGSHVGAPTKETRLSRGHGEPERPGGFRNRET
jgi:hypothetical protein